MKKLYTHEFMTAIGLVRVASTELGLAIVQMPNEKKEDLPATARRRFPGAELIPSRAKNLQVERQITAYTEGKIRRFTLPLDLTGTRFQFQLNLQNQGFVGRRGLSFDDLAKRVGTSSAIRILPGGPNSYAPLMLIGRRVTIDGRTIPHFEGPELKQILLSSLESIALGKIEARV